MQTLTHHDSRILVYRYSPIHVGFAICLIFEANLAPFPDSIPTSMPRLTVLCPPVSSDGSISGFTNGHVTAPYLSFMSYDLCFALPLSFPSHAGAFCFLRRRHFLSVQLRFQSLAML